jgi:hypothetical protein
MAALPLKSVATYLLSGCGCPLPPSGTSTYQYHVPDRAVAAVTQGERDELFPRRPRPGVCTPAVAVAPPSAAAAHQSAADGRMDSYQLWLVPTLRSLQTDLDDLCLHRTIRVFLSLCVSADAGFVCVPDCDGPLESTVM